MKWPFISRRAYDLLVTEVERLHGENRALLNAVMRSSGQPIIERGNEAPNPVKGKPRPSWFQWGMKQTAEAIKTGLRGGKPNGSSAETTDASTAT